MLYKFDNHKLEYKNVTKHVIAIGLGATLILALILMGITLWWVNDVRFISEETKAIIINESTKANTFSKEKLKAHILQLNMKFPRIVYAQACLESGNFKSDLFRTNNNLFGLKTATKRPTTHKGEEHGYAYYDTWRASVEDYAFYSATYLNDLKTESEYLAYLKQNYAEDTLYVEKLRAILDTLKIEKK